MFGNMFLLRRSQPVFLGWRHLYFNILVFKLNIVGMGWSHNLIADAPSFGGPYQVKQTFFEMRMEDSMSIIVFIVISILLIIICS